MIARQPVITAGTIAGLLLAGWQVIVDQGMLGSLTPEAQQSLSIFVSLLVPIIAAVIAARFSTPTGSPELPIGTAVNTSTDKLPTGIVTPIDQ